MHVGWHLELAAAWLLIGIVACQNNEVIPVDLDQVVEPDYRVELSVDTGIKSSPEQLAEQFACHECTDCQAKGSLSSRVCDAGVRMCYTLQKRVKDTTRIVRRGCSTSRGQCAVPDDGHPASSFDSLTCCTTPQCNQAVQSRSVSLLVVISLAIRICI